MPVCAVLTCKSGQEDTDEPSQRLSFHRFPKDDELKRKWIEMTGRDDWVPTKDSFVCSKHFRDLDYIIQRSGNRHLKVSAIPCEYVVYRDLFPIDDQNVNLEAVEEREGTSSLSSPARSPISPAPMADTTSSYDEYKFNDINDNTIGWDQFQTLMQFRRQQACARKRRSTTANASPKSKRTKKSKEKLGYSPPCPSPNMEGFPSPKETLQSGMGDSCEPVEDLSMPAEDVNIESDTSATSVEEVEQPHVDVTEDVDQPIEEVTPPVDPFRTLKQIKKLILKRKSTHKAVSIANAKIEAAQPIKNELQETEMTEFQRAEAIIYLQNKHINKLTIKYRRKKKLLKKIRGILDKVERSTFFTRKG